MSTRTRSARRRLFWAGVAALGFALACSKSTEGEGAKPARVVSGEEIPALPLDHPPVEAFDAGAAIRGAQRLSVDQLRGSFTAALGARPDGGEFVWMAGSRGGLDVYSRALGEADFLNVVEDDLDSSPLFLKFMDDAARALCALAITSDLAEAAPARRALIRYTAFGETVESHPENVERNLRDLLLRFHGVRLPAGAPGLDPLKTLYTETFTAARTAGRSQTLSTQDAWRAVCVGLFTAPEFHLY